MLKEDPIIEEIRESRKRMSAECDHDPEKFIEYLKQFNEKYAERIVDLTDLPSIRSPKGNA